MNYKQIKSFKPSKGGSKPSLCLQNVRLGYGIPSVYPDAWTAWLNTQQHKTRSIPAKVDVPLFYSYTATIGGVRKNYGHINVRLANGQVWNDGRLYASLASVEKAIPSIKYVGWGESINGVRVIEQQGGEVTNQQKLVSEPVFDPKYYLQKNKDVARHKNTHAYAVEHWYKHGIKEGRPSAENFHLEEYKAQNSDLRRAYGNDNTKYVLHYFNHGINEGRRGRKHMPTQATNQVAELKDKIINFVKGV